MSKFDKLKKLAEANDTKKIKELILLAGRYMQGLDKIFDDRNVIRVALIEIDIPMFFKELEDEGFFEKKEAPAIKLMLMDIFYITRHTWEFIGKNGKQKTGDDLHKAEPLMFEDEKAISVEELYKNLQVSFMYK